MRRNFILLGVSAAVLFGSVGTVYIPRDPIRVDTPPGIVEAPDDSVNSTHSYAPRKTAAAPPPPSEKPTFVSEAKSFLNRTGKRAPPAHRTVIIDNKEYPLRTYEPLLAPNDPNSSQWWVTNSKLDLAWDIPRGAHQTVLAVIDTGFGLNHEEFAGRWQMNAGESGTTTLEQPSALNCADRGLALDASCNLIDDDGDRIVDNEIGITTYQNPSRKNCTDQLKPLDKSCNRIDDDGNDYIDDLTGWDFINYDNSVQAGELNPAGGGTTHGTLVTGVAAATGNNSKGIAGADWETKVLPIQALDDDGYGDTRSVGRAIYYAVTRNVDVINISLGSSAPDPYVEEAIQAATRAGILVVASSGNDGCECMVWPANYPEVLAVGALNSSNVPASFSSWGINLDMLAPGTNYTTPTWQSSNSVSAYASGVNGTSFSAPLVSGMATRLLSHQPTATPMQLIAALTENTNRLSMPTFPPHTNTYGHGTLQAQKVSQRMTTAQNPEILYALTQISKGATMGMADHSEALSPYLAHHCQTGTIGSTRIYELLKTGGRFYSLNITERQKAVAAGYTAGMFTWLCLQQPHDGAKQFRYIDIPGEFRNIYTPLH